jgi:DNA-binding transcriptional LysR family regulator
VRQIRPVIVVYGADCDFRTGVKPISIVVHQSPAVVRVRMRYGYSGIGVSMAPSSVRSFYQTGVKLIPIQPDPPPLDLVAAGPAGEPPPPVAAFLDLLRQKLPRIRSKYAHPHST